MENPVQEIPGIIHLLTQAPPSIQRETIETYFTPDASFTHPFCRTGSWTGTPWRGSKGYDSRDAIQAIYRWYKILSPRIEINVQGVAFDEPNLTLYIRITQIFRLWFVPLYYAPVSFTTVLTLTKSSPPTLYPHTSLTSPHPITNSGSDLNPLAPTSKPRYYITSQSDLYQIEEWIKFLLPGSWVFVLAWQFLATLMCWVGTVVFVPVTWVEEWRGWGRGDDGGLERQRRLGLRGGVDGKGSGGREWKWLGDEDGVGMGVDGGGRGEVRKGNGGEKDWDWKNGVDGKVAKRGDVDGMNGKGRKELVGKSELKGRIVGPIS